jgi:ubiquinone/menaquinone biosynthesis C-methylase UbiE
MSHYSGLTGLDDLYADRPPWDIGRPQPAFAALADSGAITGRVLDVGCGTGEHTLMAAALGLDATGIDLSATALRLATEKARQRNLSAQFLQHDALRLAQLDEVFDTLLDSLVLHAFDSAQRTSYLEGVRSVLRPGGRLFVLCYSDWQPADAPVPHHLSRSQLERCFSGAWTVDRVEPAVCASNRYPAGVGAYLAACTCR